MDPPVSLSLSVTESSPISEYWLIYDRSVLVDVFMLLSCPGCHDIQYFKLCDINGKKKGFARLIYNLVALFVYQHSYTFFTSKQIDLLKKNRGRQKLYDANIGAFYGCRQVGRH